MGNKKKFSLSVGNGLPINFLVIALIFLTLQKTIAQQFPDTIWIPVTFMIFTLIKVTQSLKLITLAVCAREWLRIRSMPVKSRF